MFYTHGIVNLMNGFMIFTDSEKWLILWYVYNLQLCSILL
jgi:hypothetical protein